MVEVPHSGTAEDGCQDITDGANNGRPELTAGEARPACRGIVHGGPNATAVSEHLPRCADRGKRDGELQTHAIVQSNSESDSANRTEECFQPQGVRGQAARRSMKFNRNSYSCGRAGDQAEEKS